MWVSHVLFGVSLCVLFSFALGPEMIANTQVASGVFWAIAECMVALSLGQLYTADIESNMLETVLANGIQRSSVFFGKCLFTGFQTLFLMGPLCFFWAVLFKVQNTFSLIHLFSIIFPLFSLSAGVIGTLISSLTYANPLKELTFSIVFFPLQLITILACVQLTQFISSPFVFVEFSPGPWWTILVSFPIIFLLLGYLVSPYMFQDQ